MIETYKGGTMKRIHDIYTSVSNLLEKGLAKQGLSLLKTVSPSLQNHPIIQYLKGVCQQEIGDYDSAENYFRTVIHNDPTFLSAVEALLYMPDNSLTQGEEAYLCELVAMLKPESPSLTEIRESLQNVIPEPLALHENPEETQENVYTPSEMFQKGTSTEQTNIDQSEQSEESILKGIDKKVSEREKSYKDDVARSQVSQFSKNGKDTLSDEKKVSMENIHLSPEEKAVLEQEQGMKENEFLANSEETEKLKDLLKTLHERKQKDIEDIEPSRESSLQNEGNEKELGPFDTITMARIYFQQGACSSALRILTLLKKNTTDEQKLQEIESLFQKVQEKIEMEEPNK